MTFRSELQAVKDGFNDVIAWIGLRPTRWNNEEYLQTTHKQRGKQK